MILAVAIGNSSVLVGCLKDSQILFVEQMASNREKTVLEYAMSIKSVLVFHGVDPAEIEGGILSSVVPQLTTVIKLAVGKLTDARIMTVGPGLKSGLNIMIDNPAQLGSNLMVESVAALEQHEAPLIIADMGTATTLCVINEKRQYIGGVITAGVRTSLDSLVARTSLLQQIGLEPPRKTIGRNTIDSMKSGIIYGAASMLDGLIERIESEMGHTCHLVGTGEFAKYIIPYCHRKIVLDENLLMRGLGLIYRKNQ